MAKKNINKKKEKRRNPKKEKHEHWKFKNGRINKKQEKKSKEKILKTENESSIQKEEEEIELIDVPFGVDTIIALLSFEDESTGNTEAMNSSATCFGMKAASSNTSKFAENPRVPLEPVAKHLMVELFSNSMHCLLYVVTPILIEDGQYSYPSLILSMISIAIPNWFPQIITRLSGWYIAYHRMNTV